MSEIDALVGRTTDQLESLEQALEALAQISGRFTTLDGSVTAVVDGAGALVDLRLTESVTLRPASQVGPVITEACRQAAALAAEQRDRIIARLAEAFAVPPELLALPTGRSG